MDGAHRLRHNDSLYRGWCTDDAHTLHASQALRLVRVMIDDMQILLVGE